MSGSPVVLRMSSGFRTSSGSMIMGAGTTTRFLGIYSGRINQGSNSMEIGLVWRPSVILDILNSPRK